MIHYVIAGGTFSYIRPHLAVAAPAFGAVGVRLGGYLTETVDGDVRVLYTRMAQGHVPRSEADEELFSLAGVRELETNDDVGRVVDYLKTLPSTRGLILPVAMEDFLATSYDDYLGNTHGVGRDLPRLKSDHPITVGLQPAPKMISGIRAVRKDIFVVGFKTTTGATAADQFRAGLGLLKKAGINLVLANDLTTRLNMVITPEQAHYHETTVRDTALRGLAQIYGERVKGVFTRATVIPGELIPWDSNLPQGLTQVVNHCIQQGAYKPFQGVTVGHFASRGANAGEILTSVRKTNFNHLGEAGTGLVRVVSTGESTVTAFGAKPSVGGQSQRSIFAMHPEADHIVHFHCPMRENPTDTIPVVPQWPNECGSLQCGLNTARNLKDFGGGIQAVMLDHHGPNVVISRHADPVKVIDFIERNFDLKGSTGDTFNATA